MSDAAVARTSVSAADPAIGDASSGRRSPGRRTISADSRSVGLLRPATNEPGREMTVGAVRGTAPRPRTGLGFFGAAETLIHSGRGWAIERAGGVRPQAPGAISRTAGGPPAEGPARADRGRSGLKQCSRQPGRRRHPSSVRASSRVLR